MLGGWPAVAAPDVAEWVAGKCRQSLQHSLQGQSGAIVFYSLLFILSYVEFFAAWAQAVVLGKLPSIRLCSNAFFF